MPLDESDTTESPSSATDDPRADSAADWTLETQMAFDPADANSLVVTIIYAVAEVEDSPPEDITDPPLYDVVDAEALSKSLAESTAERDDPVTAEFTYCGYRIAVRSDAWVQVYSSAEE